MAVFSSLAHLTRFLQNIIRLKSTITLITYFNIVVIFNVSFVVSYLLIYCKIDVAPNPLNITPNLTGGSGVKRPHSNHGYFT